MARCPRGRMCCPQVAWHLTGTAWAIRRLLHATRAAPLNRWLAAVSASLIGPRRHARVPPILRTWAHLPIRRRHRPLRVRPWHRRWEGDGPRGRPLCKPTKVAGAVRLRVGPWRAPMRPMRAAPLARVVAGTPPVMRWSASRVQRHRTAPILGRLQDRSRVIFRQLIRLPGVPLGTLPLALTPPATAAAPLPADTPAVPWWPLFLVLPALTLVPVPAVGRGHLMR
mmetsp:Transcript_58014/g.186369  ORF Transcript_58014/g.186369 Transcript_58014/m.186369 type:complete len:225 (+) Transcript_58014:529-1203(+)